MNPIVWLRFAFSNNLVGIILALVGDDQGTSVFELPRQVDLVSATLYKSLARRLYRMQATLKQAMS